MRTQTLLPVALLALPSRPWAAPDRSVPLPNPSFEEVGAGAVDGFTRQGFVAAKGDSYLGLPVGWSVYQWGSPPESRFTVAVEKGVSHAGESALRAENLDASTKDGGLGEAGLPRVPVRRRHLQLAVGRVGSGRRPAVARRAGQATWRGARMQRRVPTPGHRRQLRKGGLPYPRSLRTHRTEVRRTSARPQGETVCSQASRV